MARANIYPTKYELVEVLSTITNRGFLNEFAQSRGIFITNTDTTALAHEVANLFLDNQDLEAIRREAYQSNNSHALSGFVVKSPDKGFDLRTNYQWIFDQGKQKLNQTITQLSKVKGTNIYKGNVEYLKKRAGRMEFLQDETSQFDFYIEEIGPGNWQVQVDGTRSTDLRELKDLFEEVIKTDTAVLTIDQSLLNTESSILYFDKLATGAMSSDWNFKTVVQLTLRKGNEDGDTKEVTSTDELGGITKAILQGEGLRENKFVTASVESGYRFNAMTYEFHHSKEPFVLKIKAEFKGRPKVFEVTIDDYEEILGTGLSRNKLTIPNSYSMQIRSGFWNASKTIFDTIIKRVS